MRGPGRASWAPGAGPGGRSPATTAAEEDLRAEVEEFLVPSDSGGYQPEMDVLYIQACDALLRAATLDRTAGAGAVVPGVPPDPTGSGRPRHARWPPLPAPEAARALREHARPHRGGRPPGLDEPVVLEPMARLRDQINAAVAAGHDPFASPVVQGAAQELGAVVVAALLTSGAVAAHR